MPVHLKCKHCGKAYSRKLSEAKRCHEYCSRHCSFTARRRPIITNGDGTATVTLTRGLVAVIDEADIPLVEGYSWSVSGPSTHLYACAANRHGSVKMHRIILNPPHHMMVDHIDGNPLNNRRANLRTCSPSQNAQNSKNVTGSSSPYKGVRRMDYGFQVAIRKSYIGHFKSEIEAARAYDDAAVKLYGEFARLNFPK